MKPVLAISHVTAWQNHCINQWLQLSGLAIEYVCTQGGDRVPSSAEGYAAILSGGGLTPVSERAQHAWMSREINLIKDALNRGIPFLGLCLGAQLLGAAVGEIARRSESGVEERGFCRVDSCHAWTDGLSYVFQWHSEGIALPRGAEVLASSEHFAVQAFRMGPGFGLQFHPDIQADRISEWIAADPAAQHIGSDFVQQQAALAKRYDSMVDAWLQRFLPIWLCGGQYS